MPETPTAIRRNFDQVIDRLNARWNLELPRLHGCIAEVAENERALPRRITSRIRFLCFRPQLNMEALLDDFEEYAKQLKSNWVFKPRQETGTIPNLPNDKSQLYKESFAKPLPLTSIQRRELLTHLDKLLDDEYQLSHDSTTYQRSFDERGRSTTKLGTNEVRTPTTSPARDMVPKLAKSATATTQNGRKRSPSRDAVEVCIASRYPFCLLMNMVLGHRVSD